MVKYILKIYLNIKSSGGLVLLGAKTFAVSVGLILMR